ncbi:GNAT family N-acetyltransferase [Pontimicrobium aquaticum]|uniref:GNAT family N-acetyltransferase n=1 Tax=Pontimicrobium aquaticum TaxID=2565367 RepID=A0A4U0EVW0_9FLAO|nr:GNAT family N-acetyltransferase [Pontimicrobium aquaticum]TJY36061.1 GNAT family N-acetyltransferase [Pontimicrobium aquaticum]
MTDFVLAISKEHFNVIAKLASIVWHEHYTSIIGKAQVEYMIAKFQTSEAMQQQAKEGYQYYIIKYENENVGYLSIKKNNDDLFLSKIYLLKDYRGKKIGKTAFNFIEEKAKEHQCKTISLTVNKNNKDAIKAYEKIGFKNVEAFVIDIGNGFVMDDYKMVKTF